MKPQGLAEMECKVLDVLIEADGVPMLAEDIYDKIHGSSPWNIDRQRVIRVHVCKIRKKLGKDVIQTRIGFGYVVKLIT